MRAKRNKLCYNGEDDRKNGVKTPKGETHMSMKTQTAWRFSMALGQQRHLTASMRACAVWAAIEEHDKILDLSCGNGALLDHLSQNCQLTVCGMCDTPEMAREASELLGDADVIAGRMEDIPWRDEAFDVVMLSGALRGKARLALSEAIRVLRPGGQFVMAAPLFRGIGEEELTKRSVMRIMQDIGFREVSFRTAGLSGVLIGWKPGHAGGGPLRDA